MVVLSACGGSETVADRELIDLGRTVYASSCASCHGANGEGGDNWKIRLADGSLRPPPHDASGHTWHHADGLLFRIVSDGAAEYGGGNMPAFGSTLTDEEVRAVIEFIKTLWGDEERALQATSSLGDPYPAD